MARCLRTSRGKARDPKLPGLFFGNPYAYAARLKHLGPESRYVRGRSSPVNVNLLLLMLCTSAGGCTKTIVFVHVDNCVRKIASEHIGHTLQLVLPFRTKLARKCLELLFMHE